MPRRGAADLAQLKGAFPNEYACSLYSGSVSTRELEGGRVIGVLLALAGAATHAIAAGSLLQPSDVISSQVLPPPPAQSSAQAQIEQDELARVERSRTASEFAAAKIDGTSKDASIFRDAIGPGFALQRLPQTALLMEMVRDSEKATADRAKGYFKRPRPWIVNPSIQACSRDDESLSSYPSGHATMAYSMGAILSRLIPARSSAIMVRAAQYAQNRIICEVHYRSDVTAGEALGLVVAERLMQKAQFRDQFNRARAELIKARLIS